METINLDMGYVMVQRLRAVWDNAADCTNVKSSEYFFVLQGVWCRKFNKDTHNCRKCALKGVVVGQGVPIIYSSKRAPTINAIVEPPPPRESRRWPNGVIRSLSS